MRHWKGYKLNSILPESHYNMCESVRMRYLLCFLNLRLVFIQEHPQDGCVDQTVVRRWPSSGRMMTMPWSDYGLSLFSGEIFSDVSSCSLSFQVLWEDRPWLWSRHALLWTAMASLFPPCPINCFILIKSALCRVGSILIVHKNRNLVSILQYNAIITYCLLGYFRIPMWSVSGLREIWPIGT